MRNSSESSEMPGGVLVVVGSCGQMSLFLTIRGDSKAEDEHPSDGSVRCSTCGRARAARARRATDRAALERVLS